MKTVAASVLIAELSANPTPILNSLIESIKVAQEKALSGPTLRIVIDTDDDFLVNGSTDFSGTYPINGDVKTAVKQAINSLEFTSKHSKSNSTVISLSELVSGSSFNDKNYKINDFKKLINRNSVIDELIEDGSVSVGGNQTLQAYISKPATSLTVGDLVINLKA